MSALAEAGVPREIDDPSVRAALQAEYVYAERLRVAMVGWVGGVLVALFALLEVVGALGAALPMKPPRAAEGIAVATVGVLAALQWWVGRRAPTVHDDRARSALWYATSLVEVLTIVGAWTLVDRLSAPVRTTFPGLVAFTALVLLSALRLDWRLTVVTAMLTAAGHAFLHLHVGDAALLDAVRPRTFDGVVLLLVVGALTALVAEQARRRTLNALHAIRRSQRLEREILHAEDAERARIGRDLHDGLGGRLSAIALMAQGLARRAEGGAAPSPDALRELSALASEGVDDVRRLARGLDPAPVDLGLEHALRRLAAHTSTAGVACTFVIEGESIAFDAATTLQLYHIAQEALVNATRHGAPSRVDVTITVRPSTITLDVRDDGIGIGHSPVPGLGLRTMAQRAALLGAVLRVRPGPHAGTVVSCVVPR